MDLHGRRSYRSIRKRNKFYNRNVFVTPVTIRNSYFVRPICVIITALAVVAFLCYMHYGDRPMMIGNKVARMIHYLSDDTTIALVPTATANESSCVTGRPCSYMDVVDIRVIVITFNRPDSLSKLLRSLETMEIDGDLAALEIWIDRDRRKASVDQQTLKVASAFNWKGGRTRVHVQVSLL